VFNLYPGQGLGYTPSKLIAFGLGSADIIAAAFITAIRMFKRTKVNINKVVITPVSEKVKLWL